MSLSFIARTQLRTTTATRSLAAVRLYATKPQPTSTEEKKAMDSVGEGMKKAGQAFQSDGAVGKEFNADGSIGGAAQAVGGPFDKDGAVGKQFTDKGSIGGTAQAAGESAEQTGKETKQ